MLMYEYVFVPIVIAPAIPVVRFVLLLVKTTGQLSPPVMKARRPSTSVVRIGISRRAATAQIKKSVFDPWMPFARHRLKKRVG